jgi:hypothetical protein
MHLFVRVAKSRVVDPALIMRLIGADMRWSHLYCSALLPSVEVDDLLANIGCQAARAGLAQ